MSNKKLLDFLTFHDSSNLNVTIKSVLINLCETSCKNAFCRLALIKLQAKNYGSIQRRNVQN